MLENSTSDPIEEWEQMRCRLEEFEKESNARHELFLKKIKEDGRAWKEECAKLKREFENVGQRSSDDFAARIMCLEQEVDALKEDKVKKDAILKDLQQRLSKLEKIYNLAN